jgi:hypothetical protein
MIGAMAEPIDDRSPQEAIGEGFPPLVERQVAGYQYGASFVALGNEIVEVFVLGGLKGLESKIVHNEQTHIGEGREPALEGLGGAGGLKLSQQLALGGEDHIVAATDRLLTQGLGDVTFARASGARR